ncbi:YbfB/YjiJ family MFS transporter [Stutzerimonas zhaodongensis]|uniref:YbfB/YjiJ family MFS transporter n=1 Tax=Stutzerimonas zhaodongensis TaxID=1176257 RepID=A0A3M2I2X7_9GAMM|nr:YbfB/YjiJ family MFS transporter [Stutzerimonas zhaodongensis]MCQ2029332.1 YbfB/YjiJ family MFS transporter [Stutzerimonas zhaodongensis]MCQ4316810.1 YbfB/YjiJ family MFS transporter [Stutzerimonas zhaodongensis]RMH92554.1 YbfB/YjiJ family MFS transporter [Stutzerimonas zhaodongensis]
MSQRPALFPVLLAGATLLLVVHGLGRFVYTPLLPWLVEDGVLTVQQGASIATWNYLGYLIGALLALRWHRVAQIRRSLPWALVLHVVTTLAQTQTESAEALSAMRLLNGIGNGLVFVQAPSLILEWLARHRRTSSSGLVYLGACVGLIVSSFMVSLSNGVLEGAERWWPAALLSIPLAWWGWRQLASLDITPEVTPATAAQPRSGRLLDRASTPLFLSYAGAGMGYILPMTFLPMVARLQVEPGDMLVEGSWLVVAVATLPSPWLWNRLGALLGDTQALRLSYASQLTGVLAALLIPGATGILLCGVLVGGTFLGTVLLTQRLARTLHPHQGPRLSAALIALYSLTQLAGPWLTGVWLTMGGSLHSAFWLGAGALLWGLGWMLLVPRQT